MAYNANHVPKEKQTSPRDAEVCIDNMHNFEIHIINRVVQKMKTSNLFVALQFADFLAERLSHITVLRIKHLSNYVNILGQIMGSGVDKAYAMFTFDHEILK